MALDRFVSVPFPGGLLLNARHVPLRLGGALPHFNPGRHSQHGCGLRLCRRSQSYLPRTQAMLRAERECERDFTDQKRGRAKTSGVLVWRRSVFPDRVECSSLHPSSAVSSLDRGSDIQRCDRSCICSRSVKAFLALYLYRLAPLRRGRRGRCRANASSFEHFKSSEKARADFAHAMRIGGGPGLLFRPSESRPLTSGFSVAPCTCSCYGGICCGVEYQGEGAQAS